MLAVCKSIAVVPPSAALHIHRRGVL
jgi:hypothetical protein